MGKRDAKGWIYLLTIPYEADAELDEIVSRGIGAEAERIADYCDRLESTKKSGV